MENSALLQLCKRLVVMGGERALSSFQEDVSVNTKADTSFVTSVDLEIETAICTEIRNLFPDHSIVGEEHDTLDGAGEYTWFIDPLDGTSNYLLGVPLYCCMLGVADSHSPLLSAVYDPTLQRLFWATRGEGAFCNDQRITLDSPIELTRTTLVTDKGTAQGNKDLSAFLQRSNTVFRSIRRFGSLIGALHMLSTQHLQAYVAFGIKPHDFVPLFSIFSEAGLSVTNRNGDVWNYQKDTDLVACHPDHQKVLLSALT